MNNLKKIRKEKKLTQDVVAEFLHVTKNTYSRYEREIHKMDPDTLTQLSKYFNISIDYILGNIEEPVTLDELRFLRTVQEGNTSAEELSKKFNLVDDDDRPLTMKDIKEVIKMLREE